MGRPTEPLVGVVREQLPSALYRVEIDGRHTVTAHIADRLRRNFIRLLVGDKVQVELTPGDRTRGRIVARISQ